MTIPKIKKKGRAGEMDIMIGKNIKAARQLHNLSQEELAQSIGVTFQQVQKYESGANRISASRLYDLSQSLNVEYDFFLNGASHHNQSEKLGKILDGLDKDTAELINLYRNLPSKEMKRALLSVLKSQSKILGD